MTGALLLQLLNATGMLAFALSGAVEGLRRGMDMFGIAVLAFVTAIAGGVLRDLLIGDVPPAAIQNWHAAALAVASAILVFSFPRLIEKLHSPVQLFDAAGLGVFAVTGAAKALQFGIHPVMAAVLGMVSGIGGGMLRDILTARMPAVLHGEIYALAALAGAAVVVVGHSLGVPVTALLLPGAALCLGLRLVAIYRHWSLPGPAKAETTVSAGINDT